MSRRRNAILSAVFSTSQGVLGMVLGLVVTRIVLAKLGRDLYGLWIASGALLSYAGFADLGVLGVLPWLIAEADGKKDDRRIGVLLSHGLAFSVVAAFGFALIAGMLWQFFPSLLHLSTKDSVVLAGPVAAAVLLTAAALPFRSFSALLTGKQDASFIGVSGVVQVLGSGLLTLVLATSGYGLYALAIGSALPPLLVAAAALVRVRLSFRAISTLWTGLQRPVLRKLAVDGFGVWLVAFGYTMTAASDPIVLSFDGLLAAVPNFAISSRLALTLTQFAWILPDAGLVGLAQLSTEGTKERVRDISLAVIRLNLLVAGAVASAVLASNGAFVRVWVGADYFLGAKFNAVLALNTILACAVHGFGTVVSVLGKRLEMGIALVANGIVHVCLASVLARHIGVYGVLIATLVSGSVTCLPVAMRMLRPLLDISMREMVKAILGGWLVRFAPLGVLALLLGKFCTTQRLVVVVPLCALFGVLYLWTMRSLYRHLPLGPRLTRWLQAVRLLDSGSL